MYHRVQFTLFHCFTLSPHHHRYRPCPQGRYHHCYCHNYYDHNKHYQDYQYHFLFFDDFPGCIDEGSAVFCQRFRKFCAHYGTANHRYLVLVLLFVADFIHGYPLTLFIKMIINLLTH